MLFEWLMGEVKRELKAPAYDRLYSCHLITQDR